MTYPAKRAKTSDRRATLMAATLEKLRADVRTLKEIAKAAEIPYDWLRAFSCERLPNPSVNRVQHLYEFLANKPLRV